MKINHTITSIDKSTGGPARSVTHLMSEILKSNKNISLDLTTLSSKEPIIDSFNKEGSEIHFYNNKVEYTKNYDLYHAQGIWQKSIHLMVKEALSKNKPYIITVRGMLEPWSLKQSYLKKKIALKLYQYKDLKRATCIHATAEMEVKSIRKLGLNNPIAMIPNGVNIDEFSEEIPVKVKNKKKILFLSRIHPKKGIENLINSWLELKNEEKEDWIIEIIGNGDSRYIIELKKLIKKHKLEDQIYILPPVFGNDKIKVYREASLFVLPTFSENFGIVIAEALASYTPVITTKGTPWEDLERYNCGWWIEIGVNPLANALRLALKCSDKDLKDKGVNGRKLIKEKYSIESVAKKMVALYLWILNKKDKPDFIDII